MINDKEMGIFVTRRRSIKAIQLTTEQVVIDKNGEKFVGLPGD